MRLDLTRPCTECPFRTDSPAGWLGARRARDITRALTEQDRTFECHLTTGQRRPQHCAGALILLDTLGTPNQLTRIARRLGLYSAGRLTARETVFATPGAFITHHTRRRRSRAAPTEDTMAPELLTAEPQTPPPARMPLPDPGPLLRTTPELRALLDGFPTLYFTLHGLIFEVVRAQHAAETLTDPAQSDLTSFDLTFAQGAVAGLITTVQSLAVPSGDTHAAALDTLTRELLDATAAQFGAPPLPEGTPDPFDLLTQFARLSAVQRTQLASRAGLSEEAILTAYAAGRTAFLLSVLHHAQTRGELPEVAQHLADLTAR
ncbi:DUF6283 family protein [Deinococcus soli (ex Cha et al. 2016)]|uniref:Uncharacterized protein n=2 Tax=Deinococcus soli (ex Cha et al. 2016) TaxID=1309411 RepID=A0ACC6KGX3_9DEIO|nr:DUF6283 family protein [Deinococcus soli (ex Cha et al. 2016)]MDR6218912.1 hypothetical protein [Deinococcus soli (ex Cha et al. 2016)]MDR6328709.1 hypothetical protein [Deinococcus soli (ex Cha et al. 2016)]MDR6751804.1 hypothetical protein [Deinococcus soli (ex Cha et al. 2016)]